ncbi:hypothetical protein SEVIR_5G144600v4 [Setaria viridis]|uniref:glutathione gamma-glutamylcysteinyltransferase n=1 Tax=Setaria italica TaxID=4555 RepID=K3XHA2_SETIT|nr:glutathione gamma-glutamylcysteinyltransferase 1 isoform X2 [Setaria italica]XP_034597168.1 glutathione gamma-glutamylcysteinyltransferase 1-like isoform X2 [Setaria viridis]
MATVASLYRRVLPSPPAVDFTSPDGKRLFSEALEGGTMEGFFSLASCFQTQSEPAFCGLASLAVVLNALAIDPGRRWKGPWRWFDESMLDCCEPLDKIKAEGITFGKVACLAHCSGADVRPFRANQVTVDDLRRHLIRCASSRDCHLIASYHRRHFKQTGTGHFSPIGGYHAGEDMALILDVACFKYPPHWVPLQLLWEAMNTADESTGLLRGFMLISRHNAAPSALYTVSCRDESWKCMAKYCAEDLPDILKAESLDNVPALLSSFIYSLPANAGSLIKWVVEVRRKEEDRPCLSKDEKERLLVKENVLQQVHDTKLFMIVHDLQCARIQCCNRLSSSSEDSVTRIAASVCCQGAAMLSGNLASSDGFCFKETCFKGCCTSSCNSNLGNEIIKYPSSADVITVLLLALHPSTWLGIINERLKAEFQTLVSTDNLPDVLKREILHLRRQLYYLKTCKDEECEDLCHHTLSSDASDPLT